VLFDPCISGLEVAIKCKNSKGEYESKAMGKLDGFGAFSIPLSTDLHGADCVAQLHSAAGNPCPGQEPSRIVPQSSKGNFVVVPGKTDYPSKECASATLCGSIKKHLLDHFHKKPVPPKPKPEPKPELEPKPEPKPEPENHPPTPTYGSSTPIYHPPSRQLFDKKHMFDNFHKHHDYHHFFDHFHKKPVPPKPKPEPKPEPKPKPQPEYHSPTPTYGSPTPIYHPPARHLFDKKPLLDHFHKDHDYHHFLDHFHKKPVPQKPKLEPKPEPKPQPKPEYHPPTPTYVSPTPIYHPPAETEMKYDKKHFFDHFHKDHDYHHFFDHFHKKPVPPKPKPEPEPKPKPQPKPEYKPPMPTYGSPTPIYHPPAKKEVAFDKKHFLDHFHKDHDYHHFFDHFHKKPVPPKPKPEPKPEPKPQPEPEYHPPTPTYGSPTPIYHPPAKH
jgi:hypothetical protein